MRATYQLVLAVHVIASLLAVIAFWIPALARKGSTLHVRAGKMYVGTMLVLAVTALGLCAMNLADPVGVGSTEEIQVRRAARGAVSSSDTIETLTTAVRLNATWLAYLAVLLLAGLRFGTRVVQTRLRHRTLASWVDRATCSTLLASGVAMLVFGWWNSHLLITMFGVFGVMSGYRRLMYMARPPTSSMEWWFQHMAAMLGTGLPLHTAFLLAVGRHLPGPPGSWRLLPAAITLLGIPAITIWTRYYRNRFQTRSVHGLGRENAIGT